MKNQIVTIKSWCRIGVTMASTRAVQRVFAAAALLLSFGGMGCGGQATTAALGTAIGVGVGVPLATRSKVEVRVEVYPQEFDDPHSALAQIVQKCAADSATSVPAGAGTDPLKDSQSVAELVRKLNQLISDLPNDQDPMVGKTKFSLTASTKSLQALTTAPTTTLPEARAQARADLRIAFRDVKTAEVKRLLPSTSVARVEPAVKATLHAGGSSGPLADELTQVVLTKAGIDEITKPENQGNWRPFAHAVSEGGAGNHNAVIYLENMGWPVLKSSKFNPSKFVEAFGKTYRVAFGALARAYGVPLAGDEKGKDVSGLDAFSSEFRKKQAEDKRREAQKKLLATLDDLVKLYDEKVKPAGALTENDAKAIKDKLGELSTGLKNAGAK